VLLKFHQLNRHSLAGVLLLKAYHPNLLSLLSQLPLRAGDQPPLLLSLFLKPLRLNQLNLPITEAGAIHLVAMHGALLVLRTPATLDGVLHLVAQVGKLSSSFLCNSS
jgi:hypothetical protein